MGSRIAEQARERLERMRELGQLEREAKQLSHSIWVLDQDIHAALQARDAQLAQEGAALKRDGRKSTTPTEAYDPGLLRRQAQDRWLEYRANLELSTRPDPELSHGPAKELVLDSAARHPGQEHRREREQPELDLSL